mgnify:CR=1 FL=1
MRSPQATHNLAAMSAHAREIALNVEQALDLSILVGVGDVINLEPRLIVNSDEATGTEEPTAVYDQGRRAGGAWNFKRAQPHQLAAMLAYALGQCSSSDVPGSTGGRKHVFTPLDGYVDAGRGLPSFTAAQRYGKTVLKRRFASCFVDSLTINCPKDDFIQATATLKATGKVTSNLVEESVTALDNVTQLTLAANAVQGATAQERLDAVQQVVAEYPAASGVWAPVTVTAVSDATPAVLTITSLGGAGASTTYKVFYADKEPGGDWRAFPARVSEPPLKVSELAVVVGGKWDGSTITGGRQLTSEIKSLSWTLNNNVEVESTPGGGADYANRALRGQRTQKLTLGREFWDAVWQELRLTAAATFSVYMKAEGALLNAGEAARYTLGMCWPLCCLTASPISADGARLAETPEIQVLQDATHGSLYAWVINKGTTYGA